MSIHLMSLAWKSREFQDPRELLVILCLADHSNERGISWPSIPAIAKKSRQSERQVQRILLKLKRERWLKTTKQQGRRGTNLYELDCRKLEEAAARAICQEDGVSASHPKNVGCQEERHGVTARAVRGDRACHPNHQIEPSKEPSVGVGQENRPTPASVPIMALPLNDGSEHPIQTNQVEEWKRLYPAVNVLQELRNMRGWLLANPRNRKTKAGVLKFVNRWLAVEQDKAPRRGSPSPAGPTADEILRQKREQPPDGERQVTPEQGRPLQGRLEV